MASDDEAVVITEMLKDFVIAEEGKSITLECKVNETDISGLWYKDSILIEPSNKNKISCNELWHKLEMKAITEEDTGIYCFAVRTTIFEVYTKCMLYVKPSVPDNVTYFFTNPTRDTERVTSHLRSYNAEEGTRFILQVEFAAPVRTCCYYRNNCLLTAKYPKCLFKETGNSVSTLFLDKVKRNDSGIYMAVGKTFKGKYLCSYADVLVANDFTKGLYNNDVIPHIWEAPPEIVEAYATDDIIFMFKVSYDVHTIIEWTKDGNEVKLGGRILCETYGNRYIALKINNVNCEDSGQYYLVLRHELSSISKISSAGLTVKDYAFKQPAPCSVTEDLKPTIVGIGNGVRLSCKFDIPDNKYTYVTWVIRHYKIERSSERFKVISSGDEYMLYIPVATPELAGTVTCQLRQHVPPLRSILLCKSKTYLAVLPTAVVEEEKKKNTLCSIGNIYSDSKITVLVCAEITCPASASQSDAVLHIRFCRMSGSEIFFEALCEDDETDRVIINVDKTSAFGMNQNFPNQGDWRITWSRPNKNDWYAIDVRQADGEYVEIGTSNSSNLDINEPPEDKLLTFRVRNVRPKKKRSHSNICYVPEEETLRNSIASKTILDFKDFKKNYSPYMRIGHGSFGYVNLVHRRNGELYTAKYTKWDKWKFVQSNSEFEILKSVCHPKTVALLDGFYKKKHNGIIFTMEYLWGGEFIEKNIDRKNLREIDIVAYVRQILLAFEYLHSKKIVYLDLKPENIMFSSRNSRIIKLIDFGMSRILHQPVKLPTMYGSRDYVSPEMINKEHIGTWCDMWSLGVLTYWILTGRTPFLGISWLMKSTNICNVRYYYDDAQYRMISDRAKVFVSLLLRRYPEDRMTAATALSDIWITKGPDEGRPRKVQVIGRGTMLFIEIDSPAEKKWKICTFVMLTIVRLRARCQQNQRRGRRFSVRLLEARQKEMNFRRY